MSPRHENKGRERQFNSLVPSIWSEQKSYYNKYIYNNLANIAKGKRKIFLKKKKDSVIHSLSEMASIPIGNKIFISFEA